MVRTNGTKISKGSNITMDVITPSHIERQVTQENGFLSFLFGNLLIKNWKNSCSAKAKPEIHNAFINIIIIYIENCHLYPKAVLLLPLQQFDIAD